MTEQPQKPTVLHLMAEDGISMCGGTARNLTTDRGAVSCGYCLGYMRDPSYQPPPDFVPWARNRQEGRQIERTPANTAEYRITGHKGQFTIWQGGMEIGTFDVLRDAWEFLYLMQGPQITHWPSVNA